MKEVTFFIVRFLAELLIVGQSQTNAEFLCVDISTIVTKLSLYENLTLFETFICRFYLLILKYPQNTNDFSYQSMLVILLHYSCTTLHAAYKNTVILHFYTN